MEERESTFHKINGGLACNPSLAYCEQKIPSSEPEVTSKNSESLKNADVSGQWKIRLIHTTYNLLPNGLQTFNNVIDSWQTVTEWDHVGKDHKAGKSKVVPQ